VHRKECKEELAYNKNTSVTSAMREHLKRKHVHVNLYTTTKGALVFLIANSHLTYSTSRLISTVDTCLL